MLPLNDDNPTEHTPVVTITFIVACCLVFLYQSSLPPAPGEAFVYQYGAIPSVVFGQAVLPPEVAMVPAFATMLTSMFLHGSWMHLIGNMLYLWVFGNNIEDIMGHARFVLFYVVCGVLAALSHALTDPTSTVPMVGASGAISGVLGAYLLLFYNQLATRPGELVPVVDNPPVHRLPRLANRRHRTQMDTAYGIDRRQLHDLGARRRLTGIRVARGDVQAGLGHGVRRDGGRERARNVPEPGGNGVEHRPDPLRELLELQRRSARDEAHGGQGLDDVISGHSAFLFDHAEPRLDRRQPGADSARLVMAR